MTAIRTPMILRTLLAASGILFAAAAAAQPAASHIGQFKFWNAYVSNAQDGKICFIAAQPQDSTYSQSISGRDPAFFMVTRIPAKSVMNETSTIIGYPFQEASKVTITVDGKTFTMFTEADTAWIEVQSQEPALVDAMKAGRTMIVQGTSRRGTVTKDTYSLSGVTAAMEAITRECAN